MTSGLSPRWRAVSRPGASARFEITTAMRALGILPAAMLSAIATKLEPRPDSRMPRFFMRTTLFTVWSRDGLAPSPLDAWMQHLRGRGRRGKSRLYGGLLAEHHFAIAFDDAADAVKFFSGTLQQGLRFLEFFGGN